MRKKTIGRSFLLLLAIPAITSASENTSETPVANRPQLTIAAGYREAFSRQTCNNNDQILINYDFPLGFEEGTKLLVFATDDESCPVEPPLRDGEEFLPVYKRNLAITESNKLDSFSVNLQKLVPNCPEKVTRELLICAVTVDASDEVVATNSHVSLIYDDQAPEKPRVASVVGGDKSLIVNWDSMEGIDHWVVHYRQAPEDLVQGVSEACELGEDSSPAELIERSEDEASYSTLRIDEGNASSGRVNGLVNGQKYEVYVHAVDKAGNEGQRSDAYSQLARTVHGFYQRYRCQGGTEEGGYGCTAGVAGSASPILWLGCLAILIGRRKS